MTIWKQPTFFFGHWPRYKSDDPLWAFLIYEHNRHGGGNTSALHYGVVHRYLVCCFHMNQNTSLCIAYIVAPLHFIAKSVTLQYFNSNDLSIMLVVNSLTSSNKVEPDFCHNTTSSGKVLRWPIKCTFLVDYFVCEHSISTVYFVIIVTKDKIVAAVITFHSSKILSVGNTKCCAVFRHLISLLNFLICYSNWTCISLSHRYLNNPSSPTLPTVFGLNPH